MASTSPPEALHTLVERCRLPLAVSAEVETLTAGFLAEDLIVPAARDAGPRARINGYALSPDFAGGRCRFESRAVEDVATRFLPDNQREDVGNRDGAGLPEAVRLESGDSIPQGFDRILAVHSAVVCGSGVVEVSAEDIPASGEGIETVGGEFELSALPVGTYILRAISDVHRPFDVRDLELKAGDILEVELEIQAGLAITGTVVDLLGRAIAGAEVTSTAALPEHGLPGFLQPRNDLVGWAVAELTVTSDDEGRFRITRLPSGNRRLVARHPDWATSDHTIASGSER